VGAKEGSDVNPIEFARGLVGCSGQRKSVHVG
jgi:hypothetical protein